MKSIILALDYINDGLIFSKNLEQHFKHFNVFIEITKRNDLAISKSKIVLFKSKIHFLGHNIFQGTIIPIERAIQFTDKFLG